MATSRPFAYNAGSPITGTDQVGDLAIGVDSLDYTLSPGGVDWWIGPDEDLGYTICRTDIGNSHTTPVYLVNASIGFNRSTDKTEGTFVQLVNQEFSQSFSTGDQCKTWLNNNGYWTSWGLSGGGPSIVTSGLISNLDAGNNSSYNGTGTTWTDLSGNGNHATLTNTTFNSTNGGGIVFGQNAYGEHTLGTSPYAGDFTFTTVFKHTDGYNQSPDWDFLYTMNSYGNGLFFGTQADKPRMSYGNWFTDGINTTGQSTLTLNNYYMLTYGRSGSSLFCYLQNTSYGTGNSTSATPTITTPYIGTTPNPNRTSEYWDGIINVILVYNRALSGSEITQNYNSLQSRFGL
jgi:hypothetical protein